MTGHVSGANAGREPGAEPAPPDNAATDTDNATGRLHWLDNLRTGAMLLGVLVHTATLANFGWPEYASVISVKFRMAVFFVASGFFAALLFRRRPLRVFLTTRAQALVVPLISGLVLLNPVTLLLIVQYHNGPAVQGMAPGEILASALTHTMPLSGPVVWHLHLWFLFSLIVYVALTPVVMPVLSARWLQAALDRVFAAIPRGILPLAIGVTLAVGVVAMRTLAVAVVPAAGEIWLIRVTMDYLPYFLLGLLLFLRPQEWDGIHRIDPALCLCAAAVYIGGPWVGALSGSEQIVGALSLAGLALVRCAVIFALLAVFRRYLNFHTPLSAFLAQSIYTVYIFHFLAIYTVASVASALPIRDDSGTFFLLVAGLTYALTFVLHRQLIGRHRVLRVLFNGKA